MYLNTLICLEENVGGYGKNGERPTGHITITSPGIVKCYVQNLRQLPKEYTVYLMSKNQNKAVRLGDIKVCDGNKQVAWKVDLNNIEGTGLKGTDIDCAAVICEGDSIGNTDTILIGYTQGKYLITSMLESVLPKKVSQAPKKMEKNTSVPKDVLKETPKVEKEMQIHPTPNIEEIKEKVQEALTPAGDEIKLEELLKDEPQIEVQHEVNQPVEEEQVEEDVVTEVIMPEGGTGSLIMPDIEGPGPVILPDSSDDETPKKEGECNNEEKECKVYVPLFEDGNVTEVELLRNLQEAFAQSPNKKEFAKKIESIIYESVAPIHLEMKRQQDTMEVDQEEAQYLNQIESALKNIQDHIGEELKEKKTLLDDEPSPGKDDLARVREIFNESDAIEPFEKKDANIEWVRITMAELISIPQLSYEWCMNPIITSCYHKAGFLILGKDTQIEQYYIGIPDVYATNRDFVLCMDKIESFKGQKEVLEEGDYGYWIVRI